MDVWGQDWWAMILPGWEESGKRQEGWLRAGLRLASSDTLQFHRATCLSNLLIPERPWILFWKVPDIWTFAFVFLLLPVFLFFLSAMVAITYYNLWMWVAPEYEQSFFSCLSRSSYLYVCVMMMVFLGERNTWCGLFYHCRSGRPLRET